MTIESFDYDKSTAIKSSKEVKKNGDKASARIVLNVNSSVDEKPIPNAIVFINHEQSRKQITSHNGTTCLLVPDEKLGAFIRVGVLPYPYDELYHTKLLQVKDGEILEVSLSVPFRSSDREEAEQKKIEAQGIDPDTEPSDNGESSGVQCKVRQINHTNSGLPLFRFRAFGNRNESELVELSGIAPIGQSGLKNREGDEVLARGSKTKRNKNANTLPNKNVGVHDTYGFLTKRVETEGVTILDSKYQSIIDIDVETFKKYMYEYTNILTYDPILLGEFTDTLWAYERFSGKTVTSLLEGYGRLSANDYIHLEEIEREARSITDEYSIQNEYDEIINRLNRN
jgi:hypothetical protein